MVSGQRYVRIDGDIYCLDHGCVHVQSTDPYQTGTAECRSEEHRPIYWLSRKGDIIE